MPPPESGLTINIGAVDGFACIGMASDPRLNLSRAPASHKGCPQISAPERSAMYSLRSRNGHLNQSCGQWSQDHHQDHTYYGSSSLLFVVRPAAEEVSKLG